MSITDSSTALDLAWTEQSVVAFTAGTLDSVTEMVAEVESKIKRGTLDTTTTPTLAEVQRWLIRAKEELAETKNYTWRRRYAYADTTAATYRYALPPDYGGGEITLKDLTNNREIELWPAHLFDTKFPDPSEEDNSEPTIACIKNRELWLVPPPDGTYRLELEYARTGDDQTATDFSWLPEIERFRCCDFAVYQAFRSLHMWEVAGIYKQDWNEGIAKARIADGKRKWARMGYQAQSWLQQAYARGYQNRWED
jgi:hypothetical protein